VVFAAPTGKLGDIIEGLNRVFGGAGMLHPSPVGVKGWLGLQVPEKLPRKYQELTKLVGID
jgi:hypothetical protein